MRNIYLLLTILLYQFGLAQAPVISYTTPKVYFLREPMEALSPYTWTGGNVFPYVKTFAGTDTQGSTDGNVADARFNNPVSIAMDNSGNLYVTDSGNYKIRKITPEGVVSTFAGIGTSGSVDGDISVASFKYLNSIAVDANGNVYVTDSSDHKIRKITQAGVVSTIAGSGEQGSADGQGTAASFYSPIGIAVDGSGNIYVADFGNRKIRKITSDGVVSTFAGSGEKGDLDSNTGIEARFYSPSGLTLDATGNLYVSDYNNHKIRKITPTGEVSTLAGSGNAGTSDSDGIGTDASFKEPRGIFVDAKGNVYVADCGNYRIRKISSTGIVTTLAGSSIGSQDGIGSNAAFRWPSGIVMNTSGVIYVIDSWNHKIRKIETTSSFSITPDLPEGILFDLDNGKIYGRPKEIAAAKDYTVTATNKDGSGTFVLSLEVKLPDAPKISYSPPAEYIVDIPVSIPPKSTGGVVLDYFISPNLPKGLYFDIYKGTIFGAPREVSPSTKYRVSATNAAGSGFFDITIETKIDAAPAISYPSTNVYSVGEVFTPLVPTSTGGVTGMYVSTLAGGSGGGDDDFEGYYAKFNSATAVALDSENNVYVTDTGNNKIRKITSTGVVSTFAGSGLDQVSDGTGTNASFQTPISLAIDSSGNIFVLDYNMIRKITPAGVVSTFAGNSSGGSADGTGTSATFNYPRGIAIDASGNLYVADSDNNKIRKITPEAVVTTVAGTGAFGSADGDSTVASFYRPNGITIDASGNIYVADSGNNKIRKITSAGVVSTFAGTGKSGYNDGICAEATFNTPYDVKFDANGNLYVCDTYNNSIRKITPAGIVSTFVGSYYYRAEDGYKDGPASVATFKRPYGIAFDAANNNIYVADYSNGRIRVVVNIDSFVITPDLPAGFKLNVITGDITGVTSAIVAPTEFTVTATNAKGKSTSKFSIEVKETTISKNNLKVEAFGESCPDASNGSIKITATDTYTYKATINGGEPKDFTDKVLTVSNLAPDTYNIDVTIKEVSFKQVFKVVIPKAPTFTAKSSLMSGWLDVDIKKGTAPYSVSINGEEQFETDSSSFTFAVRSGDDIEVKSAKTCEGVYKLSIDEALGNVLACFPNPTQGSFEISMPSGAETSAEAHLFSMGGQLISKDNYAIKNEKITLSLDGKPDGMYIARVYVGNKEYVLKIIKK